MAKALTVDDVILGEATRGTAAERYEDMIAIASVIANRSRMLGVTPQEVVAKRSEFNAYGKALPAGVENYRALAREALREVETAGPVHDATFYATPAAKHNLPTGLREETRTSGHVYFSDPKQRSINTGVGYRQPTPVPVQSRVPAPTFAERLPAPPATATAMAYAPAPHSVAAARVFDNIINAPRGLPAAPVAPVSSAPIGLPGLSAAPSRSMPAPQSRPDLAPSMPSQMAALSASPAASGKTSRYGPAPEFAYGQPAPGKTSRVGPPSVMETLRGLPTKAAPLPDAVSYGLMAEAMKSRGVMGLDGRLAANQPTSLPNRTAPNVPTPTFADRQSAVASLPRDNFAGPAGSFRSMQAPSPMADRGSRVAPVSVADRMGLPSAPAPTSASRGIMDSLISPAAAATMPSVAGSRMSPTERVASARQHGAQDSWSTPGATGTWDAPAPAPTRSNFAGSIGSPRALEGLGAPSLDGPAMPAQAVPSAGPSPVPAPMSPIEARDSWGGIRSVTSRPATDPVAINERAVGSIAAPPAPAAPMQRGYAGTPEPESFVGAPSVMDAIRGTVGSVMGGRSGVTGSLIGGAVAGPFGAVIGNLLGRQFSGSSGAIGTGTRSAAADAALAAGWSGFGPMTAAQERAARNAGSGSSIGGIFGGLFSGPNEASSSAIEGRTTSYADGRTEKSGSGRGSGRGGNTGGLF